MQYSEWTQKYQKIHYVEWGINNRPEPPENYLWQELIHQGVLRAWKLVPIPDNKIKKGCGCGR